MAIGEDEFERVRLEPDPMRQGRRATELLAVYQERITELARLRKAALNRLSAEQGMSYADVAAAFGLSKGRIGQIRHAGPPVERGFFGMGPITVAFPQRQAEARAKPVIASEDATAVDRLTGLLRDLTFEVRRYPIPVDGQWTPEGEVVAICGPKSSSVIAEAMSHDPVLSFEPDEHGVWRIADRLTGEVYEDPEAGSQAAYIGRLTVGSRNVLVIAGVHALGSVGAVEYLARHLDDLYAQVDGDRFSMAVSTTFDDDEVQRTEALCPPKLHPKSES